MKKQVRLLCAFAALLFTACSTAHEQLNSRTPSASEQSEGYIPKAPDYDDNVDYR